MSSEIALEQKDVVVSGIRLRYVHQPCTAATPGGPPLVMLHGLLGYSFCWRRNLAALSRYAEIYAPDLPGAGFSDRPPKFQPTLPQLARLISEFCDALGLQEIDLLATSHGAAVAMLMAAGSKPGRVRRLVLNAPVNPWSSGNQRRIARLSTRPGALAVRAIYPLLLRKGAYFLGQLYCDPQRIPSNAVSGYVAGLRIPGTAGFLLRMLPSWRGDLDELKIALEKISTIPTLLVWGEADRAIAPSSAEALARCFQQAQVQMIPNSGHMPYEETPEEFNRLVIEFLYRNGSSRWK